jgi:excisionase family DNA binding protein
MTNHQIAATEMRAPTDERRRTEPPAILLTIRQAAEMLAIGRTTAYELIAAGHLEVVHIGRSVRVPVEAVEVLVTRLRRTAS